MLKIDNLNSVTTDLIIALDKLVVSGLKKNDFNLYENLTIRKLIKKIVKNIVLLYCKDNSIDFSEVFIQKFPTFRIWDSGKTGTSFHCDHWYGHSKNAITFWVPLHSYKKGSGISFVTEETITTKYRNYLKAGKINFDEFNKNISKFSEEIVIDFGKYLTFDSLQIHGSALNTSGTQRRSFDFRIVTTKDLGNKDISNFYQLKTIKNENNFLDLKKLKFIKIITGDIKVSTLTQQIAINGIAKHYQLNVIAHEADIEDMNQPVTNWILNSSGKSHNIKGLIIFSIDHLSKEVRDKIENGKYNILVLDVSKNKFFYPKII